MNADLPGTNDAAPEGRRTLILGLDAWRVVLLSLTLAVVLAALGYRLFIAQPSAAAWSACLWREVPTSAANWAAMDMPGDAASTAGAGAPLPAELLKARLLGACAEALAPLGKAAAAPPVWADLLPELVARRPEHVAEDRSDPRAFVCEVYFSDDATLRVPAAHDWGHGDFNTGPIIGRRSHYAPSEHYGKTLSAANSIRFCRLIGPDGRPGRDRFQRAPLPDGEAGS